MARTPNAVIAARRVLDIPKEITIDFEYTKQATDMFFSHTQWNKNTIRVIDMILQGSTDKEIGEALGMEKCNVTKVRGRYFE